MAEKPTEQLDLPVIDKEFIGKPKIAFEPKLPAVKPERVVVKEPQDLQDRQKKTVGVIVHALFLRGIVLSPEEILNAWPEGSVSTQLKAGVKPNEQDVAYYLTTNEYAEDCETRGVSAPNSRGLTERQEAFIQILSDTTIRIGLEGRLTRAGVKRAEFRAWKRQAAFNAAYKAAVGMEIQDAAEQLDVQLLSMAQNGNLKALQYANDLMGRGPNSKTNVDSAKFVQLVLESIMRHCSSEQIQAIHADLELASKLAIER